eukprot:4060773-Pleurochrysis_carterae.AAC.2
MVAGAEQTHLSIAVACLQGAAAAGAACRAVFVTLPSLTATPLGRDLPPALDALLQESLAVSTSKPNSTAPPAGSATSQQLMCCHAALMRVRTLPHPDETCFEKQLLQLQAFLKAASAPFSEALFSNP